MSLKEGMCEMKEREREEKLARIFIIYTVYILLHKFSVHRSKFSVISFHFFLSFRKVRTTKKIVYLIENESVYIECPK